MSGKIGIVLVCAAFLAGCTDGTPIHLDMTGAEASPGVSDLAAVLAEAVDTQGLLIPAGVAQVRSRLDAQLRKMALSGPTATPEMYPTDASRWAYWYNARTAWSVKLADLAGCKRRVSSAARRRTFTLDGREMSLEKVDSILLAEARRVGDFRLAACAPGAWVNYAPLPRKPFTAEDFNPQLSEALNRLVLDEKRFVIDVESKQVRVPPMLWACRNMVISWYHRRYGPCDVTLTTALRPHLKRPARRRLESALGYVAVRQGPRMELAVPKRKIFYPGKIGRIEP